MDTYTISKLGSLVYPIMLTQEAGEISEAKAAELIGLDIVSYREQKYQAIQAIMSLLESLPSPLVLLLSSSQKKISKHDPNTCD